MCIHFNSVTLDKNMFITDLFNRPRRTYSFEFFPPKDEISAVDFGINIGQLLRFDPSFVSVTYGAGGSKQDRTFDLVNYLQNKIGLTCMAHYTCINATREKVKEDMDKLYNSGIRNLMLLRGDPPKGSEYSKPVSEGFQYASELIEFVKAQDRFTIGGAAYPEKHLEAETFERDIQNLKVKVDAGADFLVAQMFFINEKYFNFIERARKAGIDRRIIPGIIPITNARQIKRFADMSGAEIPADLQEQIQQYQDQPKKIYQIGVDFAIKQCTELLERGAPGLHFYTLNKSRATVEVFETLKHRKVL